jgi:hypothetical protein
MNKINSFENSLAIVQNALGTRATPKPPISANRIPELYQKFKKTSLLLEIGFQKKTDAIDKELSRLRLWKSMIIMLGRFLEESPNSKEWKRSELRNFISQIEICLEVKPGKLSVQQYANVLLKLDAIAPFNDGELTKDLETLDQMVQAYGNKLAQQDNKT